MRSEPMSWWRRRPKGSSIEPDAKSDEEDFEAGYRSTMLPPPPSWPVPDLPNKRSAMTVRIDSDPRKPLPRFAPIGAAAA
jgi:hypothetical protein